MCKLIMRLEKDNMRVRDGEREKEREREDHIIRNMQKQAGMFEENVRAVTRSMRKVTFMLKMLGSVSAAYFSFFLSFNQHGRE